MANVNKIGGLDISATTPGIDDKSSSVAITIDEDGNIGIAETNPASLLSITGDGDNSAEYYINSGTDILINHSSGVPSLKMSGHKNYFTFGDYVSGEELHICSRLDDGAERLTILGSSGNVGIGTTTPDQTLHVFKGSAGAIASHHNSVLTLENSANNYLQFLSPNSTVQGLLFGDPEKAFSGEILYSHVNDSMRFGVDGNIVMTIIANGNFGFGVINPQNNLAIASSTGATLEINNSTSSGIVAGTKLGSLKFTGNDPTQSGIGAEIIAQAVGNWETVNRRAALRFFTTQSVAAGSIERMVILDSGNVGIGNTSPNGILEIGEFSSTGAERGVSFGVAGNIQYSSTTSTANVDHNRFYNPNGLVGWIRTNASVTTYNSASDYRLKENDVAIDDVENRVMALRPIQYNFKVEPSEIIEGFLAHEVDTIVPQAVSGVKDAVDEDEVIIPQGMDHSQLVPLLTAALQSALTKISELSDRLDILEA